MHERIVTNSAHTNTDLLQEQMAALRAELERLNTENARLKSGELVSLQEKVVDASISSLQKQMDEHVKGIYSMIDRIDKNHELSMTKLASLEQTLA